MNKKIFPILLGFLFVSIGIFAQKDLQGLAYKKYQQEETQPVLTPKNGSKYCVGGPSSTSDSNVEQVDITGDFGTSISFSGCPGVTGLQDLTGQESVSLNAGGSYTLDVTFGTCGGSYSGAGAVWIDWNQDDVFDATTELIGESSGTPGTAPWDAPVSFTVDVPNDFVGTTTMRIMQHEGGSLPLDPCASYTWGSLMDFSILVPVAHDLGVDGLNTMFVGEDKAPEVIIHNYGLNDENAFNVAVLITDAETGTTVYDHNADFTDIIPVGDDFVATLSDTWIPTAGTYSVTCVVTLATDQDPTNDILETETLIDVKVLGVTINSGTGYFASLRSPDAFETNIAPISTSDFPMAMDYANGAYYVIRNNMQLSTLCRNGEETVLGTVTGVSGTPTAMTYGNNRLFIISVGAGNNAELYYVDLTTYQAIHVGTGTDGAMIIAADFADDGYIYAPGLVTDALYRIDPMTGETTEIGPIGFDMNYGQDISFDNANGVMRGTLLDNGVGTSYLCTIDLTTGAATKLAPLAGQHAVVDFTTIMNDVSVYNVTVPGSISQGDNDIDIMVDFQNMGANTVNGIGTIAWQVENNGAILTSGTYDASAINLEFTDVEEGVVIGSFDATGWGDYLITVTLPEDDYTCNNVATGGFYANPAQDLAVFDIAEIKLFPGESVYPEVAIQNVGTYSVTAGTAFDLTVDIMDANTGTTVYSATSALTLVESLMSGDLELYTMTTEWTTPANGTYTVVATVSLPADANLENNVGSAVAEVGTFIYSIPFEEGFDIYRPADWSEGNGLLTYTSTIDDLESSWVEDGFANNGPTGSARMNIYGEDNEWLFTPYIDLGAAGHGAYLDFDLAMTGYYGTTAAQMGADDLFAVVISTDNGETWSDANSLLTYTSTHTFSTYEKVSIDLASYEGVIQLGFYAARPSGYSPDINIYVDNVFVGIPTQHDLGVVDVLPTYLEMGEVYTPTAEVMNYTLNDENSYTVTVTITDTETGAVDYTQSEYFTDVLASGASQTYTMTAGWIPSTSGTFTVTATVILAGDEDPTNDVFQVNCFVPTGADLAVTDIVAPTNGIIGLTDIIVNVENYGTYSVTGGCDIDYVVTDAITGAPIANGTYSWTADLPQGDDVDVTIGSFTADYNMTYSITASTMLVGDEDNTNDMAWAEVTTVTIYPIPYMEDFTSYLPTDWSEGEGLLTYSTTTVVLGGSDWTSDNFGNVGSDQCAKLNIWSSTKDEWLFTPYIDLGATGHGAYLEFDLAFTDFGNTNVPESIDEDDLFTVVISTDMGQTWSDANSLVTYTKTSTPALGDIPTTGERLTIDLATYTGTIQLGFYGESTVSGADNDLFIDNFYVGEKSDVDLAVTDIYADGNMFYVNDTYSPTVTLTNYGLDAQSNYTITATITDAMTGMIVNVDELTFTNTLSAYDSYEFTMTDWIAVEGVYTITAEVTVPSDGDLTNNIYAENFFVLATQDLAVEDIFISYISIGEELTSVTAGIANYGVADESTYTLTVNILDDGGASVYNTTETYTNTTILANGGYEIVEIPVSFTPANYMSYTITVALVGSGKLSSDNNELSQVVEPYYAISLEGTIDVADGETYTFADAGGPMNNYDINENYVITFVPVNPDQAIVVDFSNYEVEGMSFSTPADFMTIYNGNNTGAPVLATDENNSTPSNYFENQKIYANNATGALTFEFTSDQYYNFAGWLAEVSAEEYPQYLTLTPADGATDVVLDTEVSVDFVDDIQAVDLSLVTIYDDNGMFATYTPTIDVNNNLVIEHTDFAYETTYSVTVGTGAVETLAGLQNQEFSWTFTTMVEPNHETDILTYSFPEQTGNPTIDATNHTVDVTVAYGTDVTGLVATFTLSEAATANIAGTPQVSGSTANDFTAPVEYTVVAEDLVTMQTWTTTVVIAPPSTDATLSELTYKIGTGATTPVPGFVPATLTYDVELPYGTDVADLVTDGTPTDDNATYVVTETTVLPGASTVTVTAEDGVTELTYTVNYTIAPNDDATLSDLTYAVDGGTAVSVDGFDAAVYEYDVELPVGTTADQVVVDGTTTDVNATYVTDDATVFPGASTVTVTAEDGTTELTYTINFTVEPVVGAEITMEVDMTPAIDAETFTPSTDVVYLTGSMTGWATPGDAGSIVMTEGADNVYYTVLNLEDGDYEYKYFVNAGWDGGEWNGGDNRVFTVAGDDMTVHVVWRDIVSINGLDANVSIYPNPTTDFVNVSADGNYTIDVIDATGKTIYTNVMNNNTTIDISNQSAGVYTVILSNENGTATYKVVKK